MLVSCLLLLASTVSAGIFTGRPANATVGSGGEVFRISWVDNGKEPSLAEIGKAKIELCIGSRESHVCPQVAGEVDLAEQGELNFTVDPSIGEDGQYYLFKYTAANNFTAYSARFFMVNMTGDWTESEERLISNLTVNPLPAESGHVAAGSSHPSGSVVPTDTSAVAPSSAAAKSEDVTQRSSAAGSLVASVAVTVGAIAATIALF